MVRILVLFLLFSPVFGHSQMASIELAARPVPVPAHKEDSVLAWNTAQPGYAKLSEQSKEFLYWVNFCRYNPQKFWDSVIVPVLRAFPPMKGPESESLHRDLLRTGPLPMFNLNTTLIQTAQLHANDVTRKPGNFSHHSTDGTDFGTRMKRAGIKRCASENIAIGSQGSLLSVLLLYLDIGLPDQGHRKSLLNGTLKETGIGSVPYGKDQVFFVQDLSCAQ